MKVIALPRQMGKTTQLIEMSAESGYYIVCYSNMEADRVKYEARKMGLNIPQPITYNEFLKERYYGKGIKGFLIDNVDLLLQSISTVPIRAITVSTE